MADNEAGVTIDCVMIRITRIYDRDAVVGAFADGRPKIYTLSNIQTFYLPVPIDEDERKRRGLDQIPEVQKYFNKQ